MFDQGFQKWLAKTFPDIVQRTDTALPIWWPTSAGPLLTIAGAATGSRRLTWAGRLLSAVIVGLAADIARNRIVPGANDNLSACAAQVALAERLNAEPVSGIRVVLASCGAEEILQGGIYGFVDRHLSRCDPAKTWVLNLDTIGSPQLIMLEGEGPFFMHHYCDPSFRDRVAAVAERATGEALRRGTEARASTDTIITSRAGYPSTCIASWEPDTKLLSNYHLMSDTAENVDYASVERATVIAEALARDLAAA
jgi:Zn-dependent M28 family amino/carboxypeptidase